MAAAIGIGIDIMQKNMIVDIGGGTTEIGAITWWNCLRNQ
jgi:actin-like ATPase involved in cell morphogenesis